MPLPGTFEPELPWLATLKTAPKKTGQLSITLQNIPTISVSSKGMLDTLSHIFT